MSALRPVAAIQADLEARTTRRAAVLERARVVAADREQLRQQIGRAVADGSDPATLRRELRDVEDEADGLERARAVLEDDLAALKAEHTAASGVEAQATADRLVAEHEFVHGSLAPLAEEATAGDNAAWRAETHVWSATKRAGTPRSRVDERGGWGAHPGLKELVQQLQRYVNASKAASYTAPH